MIVKFIGQFVATAMVVQMLPTDASVFESQVTDAQAAAQVSEIGSQGIERIWSGFPLADDRHPDLYPKKVDEDSYGIVTTARSALVQDAQSGMMLYAKRPDQVRAIGSVTKLMAALVFLEQEPDLSEIVTLDPATDLVTGGRVYLAFFDGLSLREVLGAGLVGSDNTATHSLMRFSGLSEEAFIARMNEKAAELGMTRTTFTEPTGIDAKNVSTARDLVALIQAAKHIPEIQEFMTRRDFVVTHASGRVINIENTNTVLDSRFNQGDFSITGGKTGFLPQAGYVLATSVDRAGDEIYTIVLGAESKEARVDEVKGLIAWAYKTFRW